MPRVQEKGQVTLEGAYREQVGIRPGDEVEEMVVQPGDVIERAGILVVPKQRGIGRFRGLLKMRGETDEILKELRG